MPHESTEHGMPPADRGAGARQFRVDSKHHRNRWWIRTRPGETGPETARVGIARAGSKSLPARVIVVPHAGGESRVDRWLEHEFTRRPRPLATHRQPAPLCPFERVIGAWVATDGARRAELERLAGLVHANTGPDASRRVLFISLASELEISRILIGVCLVADEMAITLLVDGDSRRQTLSILLQQHHELGLEEILRGGVDPDDVVIPLHTGRAALIPAGRAVANEPGPKSSSLSDWRPSASVLIDGGVWPVPNLTPLLAFADQVYAVVKVNETRWSDFHQLRRHIEGYNRRLDGCLVAGDFE